MDSARWLAARWRHVPASARRRSRHRHRSRACAGRRAAPGVRRAAAAQGRVGRHGERCLPPRRRPRGPDAVDPRRGRKPVKEVRWLPVIAPHVSLAVPEIVATGEPGEAYPFPWAVVRWLAGEDALTGRLESLTQTARDTRAVRRRDAGHRHDRAPPPGSEGFSPRIAARRARRGVPRAPSRSARASSMSSGWRGLGRRAGRPGSGRVRRLAARRPDPGQPPRAGRSPRRRTRLRDHVDRRPGVRRHPGLVPARSCQPARFCEIVGRTTRRCVAHGGLSCPAA